MVALAKRHQPTEDIDKIELTKEYHAITRAPKNESVEAFVDQYEALVRRMRQAKLPGADDSYMVTSKLCSLLPYELRLVMYQVTSRPIKEQNLTIARTLIEAEYRA